MVQRLFPIEYPQEQSQKFRSYRRFLKGINNKATNEAYIKQLFNFMKFHNLVDYDKVTKLKTDKLDILLEDYIDFIEQRNIKGTSVKTGIAGIELFFTMNDCIWHDKRIRKEIKKDDAIPGGQIPITTEEVNRMIECTNSLRSKAIVHFLASTGIRPGALIDPVLRIKHLVYMAHPTDTSIQRYCYAIKVYDESKEGYWAFLTPEAVKSLDNYFEWRHQQGEIFTENTSVFGLVDKRNAKYDHMTDKNVRYRLDELIKKAAVKRIKVSQYRYDKAIVYMFRKRFNTILKLRNNLNSNIAEKLMAHKKGLDGTYLQPTRKECYIEFIKAIPELTINQSQRLQEEIREQNQKISEFKKQKAVIQEQALEMEMLKDEMRRQKEMIESIKKNQ